MRRIFTLLLSILIVAGVASAAEITFDLTQPQNYLDSEGKPYEHADSIKTSTGININAPLVSGTVKLTTTNGSTPTRFWKGTSGSIDFRCYKNGTFTFETTDATVIQKIVFEGKMPATFVGGAYANLTWEGSAEKVVATLTGTSNITKIVVTVGEPTGNLLSPVFGLKAGTYYSAQTVEITNPNETGKIVYTTDGTEPTAESTEYTAELTIDKSQTVKALVIDGDKMSEVVSAEYVFGEATTVENIAAYNATPDNTVVKFANPVTAVYQSGQYLYLKDDSGVMLVYGSVGNTYANGDVVPAGFIGQKITYGGLTELTTSAGDGYTTSSFSASTEKGEEVTPLISVIGDVTEDMLNKYVKLEDVTVNATAKTITDGTNTLALYSRFSGVTIPADGDYDVYGFVAIYNGKLQLYPTDFVSKTKVANISEFIELGKGGIATITNPVTVAAVYKTSTYVNYYVTDATGGMIIYGKIADLPTYVANDVIPGGFSGTMDLYNDTIPEMINPEGLLESTETATITPTALSLEEIGGDMACLVVEITNATISEVSGKNFVVNDGTMDMNGYNRFSLSDIIAGDVESMTAIVDVRRTGNSTDGYTYATQLLPISIQYKVTAADKIDSDNVSVFVEGGEIVVQGAKDVEVFDMTGQRTTTVKGSGDPVWTPKNEMRIATSKNGVFVVVADGEAEKVVVKSAE